VAVVKANYVRRGGGAKARAKATIRYIQHRRGEDGQAVTRQLFGSDGPMERQEAYRMIDEARKGSMFYRLVLSPDPKREDQPKDLDMRSLTERTMRTLEERAGEPVLWVGVLHADHKPHRHVHVLAIVPKRLQVRDFAQVRDSATQACRDQRRMLDRERGRAHERPYRMPTYASQLASFKTRGSAPASPAQQVAPPAPLRTCACPRCEAVHVHNRQNPVHQCASCGLMLHRQKQISLQPRKEAGWQL
jgi:hypothetical protein